MGVVEWEREGELVGWTGRLEAERLAGRTVGGGASRLSPISRFHAFGSVSPLSCLLVVIILLSPF